MSNTLHTTYRRSTSHAITESELHAYAPSWVLCDCGETIRADSAQAVALAFAAHRQQAGCASAQWSQLGDRRKLPEHLSREAVR